MSSEKSSDASASSRALPDRPNLRFLKLEAKRRLAAGEFPTLHDAQLAVAREHGLPSWTALKEHIAALDAAGAGVGVDNQALTQVRWVVERFREADRPGWTAPDRAELGEHFADHFLSMVPADQIATTLAGQAARLREPLTVLGSAPQALRAGLGDLRVEAVADRLPPHRLIGLRVYPAGQRVRDPRVAEPPTSTDGPVPQAVPGLVAESHGDLGLVGLVAAGSGGRSDSDGADGPAALWAHARGWADLERGVPLRPDHRFPAYAITKLITATAVLRLVGEGAVGLDDRVDDHLRTLRLADSEVTVRHLLSHTGGVDNPERAFGEPVTDVGALLGPVVGCSGPRGEFTYSHGGFAVLGELVAQLTGLRYAEAAAGLVLGPLGMDASSFPLTVPENDPVTGYRLGEDGQFEPVPTPLATLQAAGGLWSTAPDLVRFATGWRSLLPAELAEQALTPQATRDDSGAQIGLGWLLHLTRDAVGHAGGGDASATSLLVRPSTGQVGVVHANRQIPAEPINAKLVRTER
ncbi:serine hydrolase domain-containing protein [Streptacidiphilus sp. MAP5-3]|uniref:serine hydrolase domain-containing protein n=1 Tax=unclassified Streptacidiphilus TaxID=2643834 RepID=UPI0035186A9A